VRRVVESRNLVSFVVSTALGLYLFCGWPFPVENNLLQMVLLRKAHLYYGIKYGFVAPLFTTPYIAFSILFSSAYIFLLRRKEQVMDMRLAPYVPLAMRSELHLVIGDVHHPKRPQPAATPQWLIVPEGGLFTGIAIFGAVGSGKKKNEGQHWEALPFFLSGTEEATSVLLGSSGCRCPTERWSFVK
jgi:hypothetical protein